MLRGIFGSFPEAGPFDIDPDIVSRRVSHRQVNRIFALAAAQLQHQRRCRVGEPFTPVAFYFVVAQCKISVFEKFLGGGLQEA